MMSCDFHNQGDVAACGFVYFYTLTSQFTFVTNLVNELKNGKNPFFEIEIKCDCLIWVSSPNCKKLTSYYLLEGIIDQTEEDSWRRLQTTLEIFFQDNSINLNEIALNFNFKGLDRIPIFSHFYEANKTISDSVIRNQFTHRKLMNKVKVFCSKTKSKIPSADKKQLPSHLNIDSSNQNKILIPKIKTIKPSTTPPDEKLTVRQSKFPRNYQHGPIVPKNIKDKLNKTENKDKSVINTVTKITGSSLKCQSNQKYCLFHAGNLQHEKGEAYPNRLEKDTLKLPIAKTLLKHHKTVTNESAQLESVKKCVDNNINLDTGNFVITYEVHDLVSRRFLNQRKLKTKEMNVFYGNCVVKIFNNMQLINRSESSELMNLEKCFPLRQRIILMSFEQTIEEVREFLLTYQDNEVPYRSIDKVINQKQLKLKKASNDSNLSDQMNTVKFTDKSTCQNEINYTKFPTLVSDSYFEETYSYDKDSTIFPKELTSKPLLDPKDSLTSLLSENSKFEGERDKVSIINESELFQSVSEEKETYSYNFEDLVISTKDSGINIEDQSYLLNDNLASEVVTDATRSFKTSTTNDDGVLNRDKVLIEQNLNSNI